MRRSGGGAARWIEEHLLIRSGDVHVQSLLGDRLQPRAAGRIANRRFEANALGDKSVTRALHVSNSVLLVDAIDSPCYDARRDQDETNQESGDEGPPAPARYSSLRHARRRALRARGLSRTSASEAVTARRVTVVPSGTPRQVQIGCLGGQ